MVTSLTYVIGAPSFQEIKQQHREAWEAGRDLYELYFRVGRAKLETLIARDGEEPSALDEIVSLTLEEDLCVREAETGWWLLRRIHYPFLRIRPESIVWRDGTQLDVDLGNGDFRRVVTRTLFYMLKVDWLQTLIERGPPWLPGEPPIRVTPRLQLVPAVTIVR